MYPSASTVPVALTIAGSDSGGGAGIQADLLTFASCGVFGVSAITCLTAQNPDGVSDVVALEPDFVAAQLDQVAAFFDVGAIKTGMLFNTGIIEATVRFAGNHPRIPLVVDPVMVATSGAVLLRNDAIQTIRDHLLPCATLITPNLDEAGVLLGRTPATREEMAEASAALAQTCNTSVLLKGGHLEGDRIFDVFCETGHEPVVFAETRVTGVDTHGSGCTLSSAVTAYLASGATLAEAVRRGRAYLRRGIEHSLSLSGRRFINHAV